MELWRVIIPALCCIAVLSTRTLSQPQSTCDPQDISSDFCLNGALCEFEGESGFASCHCPPGYSGQRCEIDLDFCTATTCQNGGTCLDGVGDITTCTCLTGFSGLACETDLDFCTATTCQNGGNCSEGMGISTSCNCLTGFVGAACEIDVDFCNPFICQNGGTCSEGVGASTFCNCLPGFSGTVCQVDACTAVACQNGGSCFIDMFNQNVPNCLCPSGYTGPLCEIDLVSRSCTSTSCQNGASCVQQQEGGPSSCVCPPGFSGLSCETDLDFCTPTTCQNGGTCSEEVGNSTNCTCLTGFTGRACEIDLDFCNATGACQNGGTCLDGVGSSTSCTCLTGFTGPACETDMDFCMPTTCQNGGNCSEGIGTSTSCTCSPEFSGLTCGSCSPGFSGVNCEIDAELCTDITCQNGGTCLEGVGDMTSCTCLPGFSGLACEVDQEFCLPDQCGEFGTCIEKFGTETTCDCLEGYDGDNCEIDLEFCRPTTCGVNGMCLDMHSPVITCVCALGYRGTKCEVDIEYCTMSICENGGTCVEGPGRETSCTCLPGFTGPICSSQIEAEPVPCPGEVDANWMLTYAESLTGNVVIHPCSDIHESTVMVAGNITRQCLGNGVWGEVDTFACQNQEIQQISIQAQTVFSGVEVDRMDFNQVLEDLVEATEVENANTVSQFPQDLETASNILEMAVEYLVDDLSSNPDSPNPLSVRVVEVLDNILEPNNDPGWQSFAENEVGSEQILANAENYGKYFAQALMNTNVQVDNDTKLTRTITRDNIVVQAQFVDQDNVTDILYPLMVDPQQRSKFGSAQSILPREFLLDRGASESPISAVNIVFENLDATLPNFSPNSNLQPATNVISTQLIAVTNDSTVSKQDVTSTSTASFRFTTKEFGEGKIAREPMCAFIASDGNRTGSIWATEGVTTEVSSMDEEKGTYDVICRSTHLTSFAVLLDVSNAIPEAESQALTYITYIGCSISIVSLVLAILFFIIVIGKEMFTGVHYFIHLNLAIALLLGYVVFLAGVDTAVGNMIGCAFVAALLHYLFTAVFCWMLCEGIMIYLMLVVVFSTISKKWWLFFLLGWGPPLIIVAISVGIIHDQYGTEDYCWISAEDPKTGAIWAFAVPMLVVILINIFFLIAAIRSLYKLQSAKTKRMDTKQALFKQLFFATITLLPLLGLTWVFGLLSVNRSTSFFAWIFTILNSLQGLAIFIFHVLRTEKVWGRFCKKKSKAGTASTSVGAGADLTGRAATRYGFTHAAATTLMEKTTLEKADELEDDLLAVDLDMFKEEGDYEPEGSQEDLLKYTMTVNWAEKKNPDSKN